jgi:hypothetical protein
LAAFAGTANANRIEKSANAGTECKYGMVPTLLEMPYYN